MSSDEDTVRRQQGREGQEGREERADGLPFDTFASGVLYLVVFGLAAVAYTPIDLWWLLPSLDDVQVATVFTAPGVWSARPSAEIAEIRWLDLAGELPDDLAPLLTDHVLPALSGQTG